MNATSFDFHSDGLAIAGTLRVPAGSAPVGICLGGGYASRFAAFDPRIKAVACVAGGYNDPAAMRAAMGAAGYRAQLATIAGEQYRTGQIEYLAAVSADEEEPAVMAGAEPFAYYGTERSASPGWANRLTALSVRELITVDLAVGADFLGPTPLLVVHGTTDAFCSPEGVRAAFERVTGPAEILWLDTTNHIDLYDRPEYVELAVERMTTFLLSYLIVPWIEVARKVPRQRVIISAN